MPKTGRLYWLLVLSLQNSTIEVQEKDLSDMYIINMDSKLRDTSLLTSEMKLFCHENNMYWADKAAQEGKKKNEVGNRKFSK